MNITNKPVFKAKYHLEEVQGVGTFLLSEDEKYILEGEGMQHIIPLINGYNTWNDIILKTRPTIGEEKAKEAIAVLLNAGHVVEKDDQMPSQFAAFWETLGINSQQARGLIQKTNIHVRSFGQVNEENFVFSLTSLGFSVNTTEEPSLIVVLTDDYQYSGIAEINTFCLQHKVPWIMAKPVGLKPMVGPFFKPGVTACWKCLESKIRQNREVESFIQKKKGKTEPFPVVKTKIPIVEMQVFSMAIISIIKWLATGFHESLESKIITIDILSQYQLSHFVTKMPQCPECGDVTLSSKAGDPVYLKKQIAHELNKNGSRTESSENTYLKYAHHISDLTGIVKSIIPSAWHGVGPLKGYLAGHNFALSNDDIFFIKDGIRSYSSGKGRSDAQARCSALCEAIERYSGVYKDGERCIKSSFNKLSEDAINPEEVMLFSEKQYKNREQWLKKGRFQVVPQPFDKDVEISWTPVWSITHQKVKYLPTSYLFYGFKDGINKFFCWGDSNGNAAGSCLEDAILQGFLELIERDSVCIWWYNRLRRPQVDLDSLEDAYIEELKAFYKKHNREFWVLDITTDTGIPAFVAVNRRTNHSKEDIIMGFGSHLDPRIAINRALTEMNQFIPAVMNVNEEGNSVYAYDDPEATHWWKTATIENQPYLIPQKGEKIAIDNLPGFVSGELKEQIDKCISVVHKLKLEVLILDQTKPDVGLPVVKVIVPGLRHFWARFAPGRLYNTPVKMGWLKSPKTETNLNPIPMFL